MSQGIFLANKPSGPTSHDIVDQLKKTWKWNKVGHCGTLDPMATGLLVITVGGATKLSRYLTNEDKSYEVSFELGLSTDSWDITGKVLNKTAPDANLEKKLCDLIKNWDESTRDFEVPIFSATKKAGKPLYEYARKGQQVDAIYKPMRFYDLEILESSFPKFSMKVSTSKGGYIRSFCQHLGSELGVGAVMTALKRTRCGSFELSEASDMTDLASAPPALMPCESLKWPYRLFASPAEIKGLSNGLISYSVLQRLRPIQLELEAQGLQSSLVVLYDKSHRFVSLIHIKACGRPKIEVFLSGS